MKTNNNPLPTVSVGSKVHIREVQSNDREKYILTRPGDEDIRQDRISTLSPIGKAIYGTKPGDIVRVDAPGGQFLFEVVAVEEPQLQYARDG